MLNSMLDMAQNVQFFEEEGKFNYSSKKISNSFGLIESPRRQNLNDRVFNYQQKPVRGSENTISSVSQKDGIRRKNSQERELILATNSPSHRNMITANNALPGRTQVRN